MSRLGHRDNGHGIAPFIQGGQQNESQPDDLPGKLRGVFPEKEPGISQENPLEQCWEGQPGGSTTRLTRLSGDGGDDNSRPNTDGCAERATTDRSAARKWERARTGGRADDALPRRSKR